MAILNWIRFLLGTGLLLVGLGGSEEDFLRYKAQQLLAPELFLHEISQ